MGCAHPLCAEPGGYDKGGFLLCLSHFLIALMWEQPRHTDQEAA